MDEKKTDRLLSQYESDNKRNKEYVTGQQLRTYMIIFILTLQLVSLIDTAIERMESQKESNQQINVFDIIRESENVFIIPHQN